MESLTTASNGSPWGPNHLIQRFAGHTLHRDKRHAIAILHLMHSADIGMIQGRGGARFTLKSL